MPKPSDFFIGVMGFFAVLVPGALATGLLVAWRTGIGADGESAGNVETIAESAALSWVAFLLASYLLGHLLFGLGSLVLDPIYDCFYRDWWVLRTVKPWRCLGARFNSRLKQQEEEARKASRAKSQQETTCESSSGGPQQTSGDRTARPRRGKGDQYQELKDRAEGKVRDELGDQRSAEEVGFYKWAETAVSEGSARSSEVLALQADSKMFRSLVLVLVAALLLRFRDVSLLLGDNDKPLEIFVMLGLLALCFWRFANLRLDASILVYVSFLQAKGMDEKGSTNKA